MNFESILQIITFGAIIITFAEVYLKVNKIWKRKAEKEVAESQSIMGFGIALATSLVWAVYNIVNGNFLHFSENLIYIVEAIVFILIGTGLWVRGRKKMGLWKLLKDALKLERKEADYLLKRFFKPVNAETILNILHQVAMIDEELNPKEEEILKAFAREWNINYNPEKLNQERKLQPTNAYIKLRESLLNYLNTLPPLEQAKQLQDMIETLIKADEKISEEEELIFDELRGIILKYLDSENVSPQYKVLIVPQKPEHEDTIKQIHPTAIRANVSGGIAYIIGSYYSKKYAEMICEEYRNCNLFTIVHIPETEVSAN